jgi:hypothetical protein
MHTIINPIKNLENIELLVDNINKTKFSFSENAILRGQKVKYIDIPQVSEVSVTPTGRAVVNATVYAKAFLVLSVGNKEQINRIPLRSLDPFQSNGVRIALDDLNVDWTKSYIEIGSIAGLVLNEAFFLNIYF